MVDLNWLSQRFPDILSPRPIGRGGQKLVFSGYHAQDGNIVLKLFHPHSDVERVIREVRAARDVPSSRIPKIYDTGVVQSPLGGVIWVREELVQGGSLREKLQQGTLTDKETINLAVQMLEALSAAERVRIVHRDVKPDNIMAESSDSFWLVDFGLARHLDMESLTATALAYGVGTPGYAPPEQYRNIKSEIDARADLFGLGITLFECVEGYNPYRQGARDMLEILRRVENNPVPPLSRDIDKDGGFRDLVLSMTRIQPDHRPRSAADALSWMMDIVSSIDE